MRIQFQKKDKLFLAVLSVLVIVVYLFFISSCTHSTQGLSSLDTVCFEKEVLPIFQTNCAISGCHDGSLEEIRFTDYNSIRNEVTPNDPKNSRAYEATISTWGGLMPPSPRPPLSKEQRTLIFLWIEQGATNTTCK